MRVNLIKKRMFAALIYYAPWVNIINYRISAATAYTPILLIFCVLFLCGIISRTKLSKGYFKILRTHFLFFISLLALFTYYLFSQSFDSLFLFFNLFAFLIVILPLLLDIGEFSASDLDKYISYLIIIISGSIMVDFILMEIGFSSYQLMYKSELHSYLDRPFGLFGQPSVNSSLLCFFYLIKRYINDKFLHEKAKTKYLFLVTIAIIAQGSGSGYISFFIMLIPILSPYFI